MKNSRAFRRMRGLSLIELMIAIVLGGLVVVAVGNVYLSTTRSFRTQEGMARMQEGARFAFETIGYDLRQTGFGCRSVSAAPVDATWYKNLFTEPLRGYRDGAGSPTAALDVDGTDAIRILRADKNRETTITAPGTTNAAHGMNANGLVVISDAYADATVYVVATAPTITTYTLGAATPCTAAAVPDTAGFHLLPLAAHIYYIRNNPSGEPSLYRQTLQSNGTVAAEELVEGVEDMQILYGEDTTQATVATCPDDGCSVDAYVEADGVTDWNRVVSVRITLTMRTADNLSTDTGGADSRIRRTYTTTIAMRNRLL
jgi:type IV pilus assembly protein PilW